MFHCDWSCESHQDGRNYEERRIWEGFNRKPQAVSSKIPTQQEPKAYVAPGKDPPPEVQTECC